MHPHQPLDAALEARLSRLPKAELHFHFEGAFRWSTIRELHPDGNALPEREPWLTCARPFADFQDFSQVFRDYIKPAGTPEAIERHAFEMLADLAQQNVRYVEILLSPKFHMMLGLTKEQVWCAAVAGCRRAMAQFDISVTKIDQSHLSEIESLIENISKHCSPPRGETASSEELS